MGCEFTAAGVEAAVNYCRNTSLVCRALNEVGGIQYDPSLALLTTLGFIEDHDIQAFMLDVDMTLGSSGLTIVRYPLPGIFKHMALVSLLNEDLAIATYDGKVFGDVRSKLVTGFSNVYPL